MPATQSKIKSGTLTLGSGPALAVHTQASNVVISPKTSDGGDALELVSGEVLAGDGTTEWTLKVKLIQDFDDPEGVINYSWDNEGETVPYSWQPNADAPTYTGTLRVDPIEVGGDAGKRLDVEVEWILTGKPTRTFPA